MYRNLFLNFPLGIELYNLEQLEKLEVLDYPAKLDNLEQHF